MLRTAKRLGVVILVYVLSLPAILLSIGLAFEGSPSHGVNGVIELFWVLAWLIHAVLSGAWIIDFKLNRYWPLAGVVTGSISFLAWFVATPPSDFMESPLSAVALSLGFTALQAALVAPALLLAVHLVRFHLGRTPVTVRATPGAGA